MRYLFDDCRLDVERRELSRGGALVAVEPQVFDLLVHLIQHRNRVISKDDLLGSVWQGRAVSDSALSNRINAARTAVGDSGDRQALIKTSPRKGFRFVGEVHEEHSGSRIPRPFDATVGGVGFPLPHHPSIAVLPFADMSDSQDQEHFADGITEDLITGLSRIRWLFVIARNSSFVYKNRAVDVKQVAAELGVRYVVEGSVRRVGNRLRVTAQLVDALSGIHCWAERYDRLLGDMFAVQDEITTRVAAAIEPQLLAAEGSLALAHASRDLDAWEAVARAQTHFWRLTRADWEAAIGALEQVIPTYPDYAPARGLLGFCLIFAAHMGWIGRAQGLQPGRVHAVRAIALDDRNPWGHIALGYAGLMLGNTEESLAAFRQAVDLNPSSASAHSYLSHGLGFAGRDQAAIEHGEIAVRLSPLDPEMARFLGGIGVAHYTAKRFADAVRYSTEALRLRPGFQGAHRLQCASLAQMGNIDEARLCLAALRREQPQLTVAWIREYVPYQTPELMELFVEGMQKAGLDA